MNCIIIDDEAAARLILKKLCAEMVNVNVVAEFENAIEAIKYLNNNQVDIVLLDIHLQYLNGLDFIETLKNPPKIILISSDKSFAFDAFQHNCVVDYIAKPVTLARLKKAVIKTNNFLQQNQTGIIVDEQALNLENDIFINIDKRLIKIKIARILLIESKGDYISVNTEDKNYIVHSTLKKIHKKLPNNFFVKVHRSYVVNILKISSIEENTVIINKKVVPISRSNRPELMDRLNLL